MSERGGRLVGCLEKVELGQVLSKKKVREDYFLEDSALRPRKRESRSDTGRRSFLLVGISGRRSSTMNLGDDDTNKAGVRKAISASGVIKKDAVWTT